jgi:methylthioribulose-1-phosphate dehydratase
MSDPTNNDHLVQSTDPEHPANLIPDLCRKFYNWGWVTGTGGGVSTDFAEPTQTKGS